MAVRENLRGLAADGVVTFADWRDRVFLAYPAVERRLARGKPVGVVNGVFDLFHLGHLNLLRQAGLHARCLLLVLLNTDASAARLKGPHRPYVPLAARLELVTALPFVSAAAGFAEDTPAEALARIRPDFLFKGDEYRGTAVPGAEFCGEVVYFPETPGFRTTALEVKIAAGAGGPAVPAS